MNQDQDHEILFQLIYGYWLSQAIGVAAKLNIAELLKDEAKSIDELARASESHPYSLYRLLRSLASVGVFVEIKPRYFAITPLAEYLQSDRPNSLKNLAITAIDEWRWRVFTQMYQSVKKGEPAIKAVYSVDSYWEYLEQNQDSKLLFSEGLFNIAQNGQIQVLKSYDFSNFTEVIDVAGGQGIIISSILKDNPHMTGILFDLPSTVAKAASLLETEGIANRCKTVGGDMFQSVPSRGQLYILSYVMTDWDDDSIVKVLQNIRSVILENGKVLVIDTVIPPNNEYHWSKWDDLFEMCMGSGRVRTQEEFKAVFENAGFRLVRYLFSERNFSLMELEPV